jgi:16S rRNA (adenine1518-N6/adenine1519-N6)-dimethyltransferase
MNEYIYLSKSKIREFLESNEAAIRKKWGQNFLTDPNIIQKILNVPKKETIEGSDWIAEIGPGLGALTHRLPVWNKPVCLFEIDPKLIAHLQFQDYFKSNQMELIPGDVLNNLNFISHKKVFVYGNLPYYISSEIISSILKTCEGLTGAVFLLQKEFADRIAKSISSLSIFARAFGTWTLHGNVSGNCFFPKPTATSAILEFTPHTKDRIANEAIPYLETILRGFFWGKRKTISKILDSSPFLKEEEQILLKEIVLELGLERNQRPEEIPEYIYYKIASVLSFKLQKKT